MEKSMYDNFSLRLSLSDLAAAQIENLEDSFKNFIPEEICKKIRNVIVLGSKDSYAAAKACIPAFKKYNNAFGNQFEAVKCIDFSRFYKLEQAKGESTLVIVLSPLGEEVRAKEALLRAKKYNYHTLFITGNKNSELIDAADYTLLIDSKSSYDSKLLKEYTALLITLYAIAAYLGEKKQLSDKGSLAKIFCAITEYIKSFEEEFLSLENQIKALAKSWRSFRGFEFIGDNIDFASALYMADRMVSLNGIISTVVDSENWCHVNYFAYNPENIGTVFISDKNMNNKSRIIESINQAKSIKRPVLLITNGTKQDYQSIISDETVLCKISNTPDEFDFLRPLLNHIPGVALAHYISMLNGCKPTLPNVSASVNKSKLILI